jgi:hypothetical protein
MRHALEVLILMSSAAHPADSPGLRSTTLSTTPNRVGPIQYPAMIWLVRVVGLMLIVGGWLLYANGMANRRGADELRARGRTTIAMDPHKNPLDRWKEQMQFSPYPTKAYLYVVDGEEYRASTTKKDFDPIGKTVTYLPEDPNVHQVGDIQPEAGIAWWDYVVFFFLVVVFGGLTIAFFLFALLPPGEPQPTRAGECFIVALAVIQFTIAWVTTTFFQVPLQTLLAQGVPLFVGGTVLAVAGVRLFAWSRGIALRKPAATSPALEGPTPIVVLSRSAIGAAAVPARADVNEPARYYVVTRSGEYLGSLTADAIRFQLRTGELRPTWLAAESDGRSYHIARAAPGLRWHSLADLLSEWGETIPAPESIPPDRPGYYTLLAIPAGASGALALAIPTMLLIHLVAAIMTWLGTTTLFNTFYTSSDSILLDLSLGVFVITFGAMRGMAHEGELKGRPANWRQVWSDIAGRTANDLGNVRNFAGYSLDMGVTVIFAIVCSAPVVFVLVLVWNG